MDAKKLFLSLAMVFLICSCRQETMQAQEVYKSIVPEDVLLQFERVLAGVSPSDDYIIFCSSENEYVMYVGDIERNDTIFTSKAATEYSLTYRTDSFDFSYGVSNDVALSVDVSDSLVYTSLGNYPMIEERSDVYEMFEVVTLLIMLFAMLFFSVTQLVKNKRL